MVDLTSYNPPGNSTNRLGNDTPYELRHQFNDTTQELEIVCGPLLNYKYLSDAETAPVWNGSVLVVATPGQQKPVLHLRQEAYIDVAGGQRANGIGMKDTGKAYTSEGVIIYADPSKAFWQFTLRLTLQERESRWSYNIPNTRRVAGKSDRSEPARSFVVPAATDSMRIMFHSCNGFSVGTDIDAWSGPALWNDVLRIHEQKPFHVMIGGGDQIYNDGVRVDGPLNEWSTVLNPHKRREYPFSKELRAECDEYYFQNYVRWYSTEPFATANGQIPQINIWDDHDIIDGFGSYTDHFMRCPVFRGIGGVSFKYYCLFQHHIPPPRTTYTSEGTQTVHGQDIVDEPDSPDVLDNPYVLAYATPDSSFIIGASPGPYVEERSRSLYARLGANIAFVGIDARTERTRHQVNYPETYDLIFQRLENELSQSQGKIKHLIVLLGVPIAYPRLVWLENLFTSPIIAPIRLLNKRFGLAGGLFNHFDGQVDLLDDLDDHYTARQHKKERKDLILRLQSLAAAHSVRVTILGGDVHLAAAGRFYSKPKHNLSPERDPRYMVNIISSAITNKPPPQAVANLLARRNRIHHLDHETDETLLPLFDRDPGNSQKTASHNHVTMPSRNYAIITEVTHDSASRSTNGGATLAPAPASAPNGTHSTNDTTTTPSSSTHSVTGPYGTGPGKSNDGHRLLGSGEEGAGSKHAVASGVHKGTLVGGLDVCYRVEVDQHDKTGRTEGYGFSIPALMSNGKGRSLDV